MSLFGTPLRQHSPSALDKMIRFSSRGLQAAFFTSAVAVTMATAPAAELAAPETAQLLANLQEHRAKFPSLTADFTEEKTTHLLQKPLVNQGTLSFQVPNKFRRELRGSNP